MNVKAEPIKVDSKDIACDGGGGQLGHPRVFLATDDEGRAKCPYCGQVFQYEGARAAAGH
ncbi:MAG: zinc-finger domain-containing protein [Alphaproteobacteria bacterium]